MKLNNYKQTNENLMKYFFGKKMENKKQGGFEKPALNKINIAKTATSVHPPKADTQPPILANE